MCKVVEDLCNDARNEGRNEGRKQGIIEKLCDLVQKGLLALSDAVEESGLSEQDFLGHMRQLYPNYRV